MARTMIDINQSVFQRLLQNIDNEHVHYHLITHGIQRNIIRSLACDENWLQNLRIANRVNCFIEKEVIGIEFENEKYVVFYESDDNLNLPFMHGVIEKQILNAGLMTVLFSNEGKLPLKLEIGFEDELINNIFGIEDELYELALVQKYFQPVEMWKISDDLKLENNTVLYKLYTGRLLADSGKLNLNFESDTLHHIKSLLESSYTDLLSEKVFKAITSTHWVQVFLEFYRCIEFLYKIPYISEFHGALQSYDNDGEIMTKIVDNLDKLGWKRKEEDSILNLFNYYDEVGAKKRIHHILFPNEPMEIDDKVLSNKIARGIYKLRNKLVHWRSSGDMVIEAEYDWNHLTREMILFINHYYSFFKYEISCIKM